MSSEKFAELCEGTADMLKALAEQARRPSSAGEITFYLRSVPQTIKPLADIIVAIAESAP